MRLLYLSVRLIWGFYSSLEVLLCLPCPSCFRSEPAVVEVQEVVPWRPIAMVESTHLPQAQFGRPQWPPVKELQPVVRLSAPQRSSGQETAWQPRPAAPLPGDAAGSLRRPRRKDTGGIQCQFRSTGKCGADNSRRDNHSRACDSTSTTYL